MKKAYYIFKEYYLISLIISFSFFLVFLVAAENEEDYLRAFIFGTFFIMLFLVIDTLSYLKHEYFRPKKIERELNSQLFYVFKKIGFKLVNNEFIGQIRNYCVCVGIEWETYQRKPNYQMKVLYDPLSLGRFLKFEEYIEFNDNEDNDFFINLNFVEKSHSKKDFSKYKDNESLLEIDKIIDYLYIKKLDPLDYKEWLKSIPDVNKIEREYLNKI